MEPPAPSHPVRLRAGLRGTVLPLLAAAAACFALAAGRGHVGLAWTAWATGAYVSWTVALSILARRRLARAARGARRLSGPLGEAGSHRLRGRALATAILALLVGVAAAAGTTHLVAGILAAGASAALAAAGDVERLERRLGGALYVDRGDRFRGLGLLDPQSLWLSADGRDDRTSRA